MVVIVNKMEGLSNRESDGGTDCALTFAQKNILIKDRQADNNGNQKIC